MIRKTTVTGETTADIAVLADGAAPAPVNEPTLAQSFVAWWDENVPNSAFSRNTAAYNKAFALRRQFLSILSEA